MRYRPWERIAEKAIAEAEHVDCSLSAFVDGLRDIEAAIADRRRLSKNELD